MNTVIFKRGIIFILVILVILIGYYFRSYYEIEKFLPGSPYEIFSVENIQIGSGEDVKNFSDKTNRYPFPSFLNNLIPEPIKEFHLLYFLFLIPLFFLGKNIAGSRLGGILTISLFSIAGENLIFYTNEINNSGLSYLLIITTLLFLYKFIQTNNNYFIIFATISSVLNSITYHTGATALVAILIGIALFNFKNKKIICSTFISLAFYFIWIYLKDFHQFNSILKVGEKIFSFEVLIVALFVSLFGFLLFKFKDFIKEHFSKIIPVAILFSLFLVFYQGDLFNFISYLGFDYYYVSSITLNNYIAQIILTHIYILYFSAQLLFSKQKDFKFLGGWFVGLGIIFVGLLSQGYIARILDYSFFFAFVLFALYFVQNHKNRLILIPATIILLIISQFMIFNDHFSMRRYYNQDEYLSAEKVSNLNLEGFVVSDLRTSALMSHFGYYNVNFQNGDNSLYKSIFYKPELLKNYDIDYVILSQNMKKILYSGDYPTILLTEKTFDYYKDNFETIYQDEILSIYDLKK